MSILYVKDFENSLDKLSFSSEQSFDINQNILVNNEDNNSLTPSNFINAFNSENNIGKDFIRKNDSIDGTNIKIYFSTINLKSQKKYRKDAYYKHFKAIFGKFIKKKVNELKNKCFPLIKNNNFSTPSYKYIGNPKETENYNFLCVKIKDLLIYGKEPKKHNRQYNNQLIINYIENNEQKSKDKLAYEKLISFLNDTVENIFIQFYKDKEQFDKINNDKKCIFYDETFKKKVGISLLETNGFIKVVQRKTKY
jgi:hypothetical protein